MPIFPRGVRNNGVGWPKPRRPPAPSTKDRMPRKRQSPPRSAGRRQPLQRALHTPRDNGTLAAALREFSRSPRYEILKHLLVGRYVAVEAATSPLHHTTFAALIERLDTEAVTETELEGLTPAEHDRLVSALTDLSRVTPEDSPPQLSPAAQTAPLEQSRPLGRSRHTEAPLLSSVQAERVLTDAIATLRASPHFPAIRFTRLGEFWQDDWARAPFEEALTLQQIAEMKVATLLEKRSLSQAKILHVVGAIEYAIGKSPGAASSNPSGETVPAAAAPEATVAPTLHTKTPPPTWAHTDLIELPPTATASLKYIQSLGVELREQRSPFGAVLAQIPATLSAAEAAVAWFRIESSHEVVAGLLRLPPDEVTRIDESARAKLSGLLSQLAPRERRYFEIALRHAAMPIEPLLHTLGGGNMDPADQSAVVRLLVTTLGAVHPVVHGRTLHRYYTLAPHAAEVILTSMVARLPRADEVVRRELAALLPFVPAKEAIALLETGAHFDTDAQEWREAITSATDGR
jgi:hypothetical protein